MLSVRARLSSSLDPTHASARRLGLATLPLTCVVLRIVSSNFLPTWRPHLMTFGGAIVVILSIAVLWATKVFSSMCLLVYAARVVRRQKEQLELAVERQIKNASISATEEPASAFSDGDSDAAAPPPPPSVDLVRMVSVGSSSARRKHQTMTSPNSVNLIPGQFSRNVSSFHFGVDSASTVRPITTPQVALEGKPIGLSQTAGAAQLPQVHGSLRLRSSSMPVKPPLDHGDENVELEQQLSERDPGASTLQEQACHTSTQRFEPNRFAQSRVDLDDDKVSDSAETLTPAQLQSLLMIGSLSQVERYSLHGCPMPM